MPISSATVDAIPVGHPGKEELNRIGKEEPNRIGKEEPNRIGNESINCITLTKTRSTHPL